MRGSSLIIAFLVLVGLAGCQGLRAHAPAGGKPPELAVKGSGDASGQLASQPSRAKTSGVLAGQVIDDMNRRRSGVTIQVAPLDGGAALHAGTDEIGYFVLL